MKGGSVTGGRPAGRVPWKRVTGLSLLANGVLAGALLLPAARRGGAEVDRAIDEYFRVWSAQDMEGYRNCFHPAAVIHFVDGSGVPQPSGLGPFVESQRQAHASAAAPMREIPVERRTEAEDLVARSRVRWKLFKGGEVETGTDYFTFVRTRSGWKIVSLVFHGDRR